MVFVFFKGRLPISLAFRLMPLEAVNRFAFASQKFSAEDVIAILKARYSGDDSQQEKQKMLFQDVLTSILRDWANEDASSILKSWANEDAKLIRKDWASAGCSLLHCFVMFCTGKSYLPHPSENFKITVSFEKEVGKDYLPRGHTCVNEIALPVQAYNANRETFQQKLRMSIAQCNIYTMH